MNLLRIKRTHNAPNQETPSTQSAAPRDRKTDTNFYFYNFETTVGLGLPFFGGSPAILENNVITTCAHNGCSPDVDSPLPNQIIYFDQKPIGLCIERFPYPPYDMMQIRVPESLLPKALEMCAHLCRDFCHLRQVPGDTMEAFMKDASKLQLAHVCTPEGCIEIVLYLKEQMQTFSSMDQKTTWNHLVCQAMSRKAFDANLNRIEWNHQPGPFKPGYSGSPVHIMIGGQKVLIGMVEGGCATFGWVKLFHYFFGSDQDHGASGRIRFP